MIFNVSFKFQLYENEQFIGFTFSPGADQIGVAGDKACVCMVNGVVVGSIYSYDSTSCSELCKELHGDNAEVKKEQVVDTSPFV